MKVFLTVCFLTAALASGSSISNHCSENGNGSYEYVNVTISPFQKIVRTNDITFRDAIYSTPAVVFVGTNDNLLRCLHEDPTVCEEFYKTDSRVHSLAIAEDYIYAGLRSGIVLKCKLNEKDCTNFETRISNIVIESLASANGDLYVGLANGTILRCDLDEVNSCRPFHRLGSTIFSMIQFKESLYVGLWNGQLMRCSFTVENSCTLIFNMTAGIMGFATARNSILAVTWDGNFWTCSGKSDQFDYCVSTPLHYKYPREIAYFNGFIYTLENDKGIYTCSQANIINCNNYGDIKHSSSMVLAYGTYQLQNRFRNEDIACSWQSESKCPPLVTYYDAKQRVLLEVHVKDERLYNSLGALVDTTNGDEGSSGPSAIFVMTPDGTLLLSNSHKKELLHTSSLFAGKPVSAAGEMVVRNGVIERIVACSEHYRSDLNLNRQVVQSLLSKGYKGSIDSRSCDDVKNDQNESNNVQ